MAIYSFNGNELQKVETTTFNTEGILERQHLQAAIKHQIEVIAPNCLVISEEFSEWSGSQRRIDLLAVDKEGNLVVIELKCTETGAIRGTTVNIQILYVIPTTQTPYQTSSYQLRPFPLGNGFFNILTVSSSHNSIDISNFMPHPKTSWIPAFAGMTAVKTILRRLIRPIPFSSDGYPLPKIR